MIFQSTIVTLANVSHFQLTEAEFSSIDRSRIKKKKKEKSFSTNSHRVTKFTYFNLFLMNYQLEFQRLKNYYEVGEKLKSACRKERRCEETSFSAAKENLCVNVVKIREREKGKKACCMCQLVFVKKTRCSIRFYRWHR